LEVILFLGAILELLEGVDGLAGEVVVGVVPAGGVVVVVVGP
jgi:hypothetical protein